MTLTELLLKGTAEQIAESSLAPGIGKKTAQKITATRGESTSLLDLIQYANKSADQETMLNTLVREEESVIQQGRQGIINLIKSRGQDQFFSELRRSMDAEYVIESAMPGVQRDPARLLESPVALEARHLAERPIVTDSMPIREAYSHAMDRMKFELAKEANPNLGSDLAKEAYRTASRQQGKPITDPSRLLGYDEAAHTSANLTSAREAMSGGTSGNFIGMFRPDEGVTQSSVSMLNSIGGGANPLFASMGLGALVGGAANYAAGGEFGEGAVAGGLAGGGIAIGARAIRGNASAIEGYMQRQVTGQTGEGAINAIRGMESAPEGLNLMQRGMYNILKSESPSIGMQSRYAVATGSGLSGMMFTGRRNDKRRGFNSHRGNRI